MKKQLYIYVLENEIYFIIIIIKNINLRIIKYSYIFYSYIGICTLRNTREYNIY